MSKVCDLCKKEPKSFNVGNDEDSIDEIAYYHIVPRDLSEATVLMSNLEYAFKVMKVKQHPLLKDEIFICGDCYDNLFPAQPDHEDEEFCL